MTEKALVKAIYGGFVRYICPNCGCVIDTYKHVVDVFIENDIPHICEDCGEPIKFK